MKLNIIKYLFKMIGAVQIIDYIRVVPKHVSRIASYIVVR